MKEFFKPTKAKFILMLIIPFYLGVLGSVEPTAGSQEIVLASTIRLTLIPFVVLFFGAIWLWATNESFFANLSQLSAGQTMLYFFLEIVFPLLINYLIACVIVCLYKRYRKRQAEIKELSLE